MPIIRIEKKDSVAILFMNRGENRHNLDFANTLSSAIDEALADVEVSAIVLTGTDGKNFSQGIDLEWMMGRFQEKDFGSIKAFLYKMNEVFKKLLLAPVPTIAAINGHAFGNGTFLACSCDFRFMRNDRGFFCFPEVDLGIPFIPAMIAISRKAFPEYKFNEMKLTGKRAGAKELEEANVVVKACDSQESLMEETLNYAKTFRKKRGIFGEHKKRLHKHIFEIMEKEDPAVIESLTLFIPD